MASGHFYRLASVRFTGSIGSACLCAAAHRIGNREQSARKKSRSLQLSSPRPLINDTAFCATRPNRAVRVRFPSVRATHITLPRGLPMGRACAQSIFSTLLCLYSSVGPRTAGRRQRGVPPARRSTSRRRQGAPPLVTAASRDAVPSFSICSSQSLATLFCRSIPVR